MPTDYLDTNVIVRYVTADNPDHSARAQAYLEQLETGERSATTREGVLVEVVQVLESKRLYHLARRAIADALGDIILMPSFKLPTKALYLRALALYAETNLDFVDTLNVAHMEHAGLRTIVSFDRGYDRVSSVVRREP